MPVPVTSGKEARKLHKPRPTKARRRKPTPTPKYSPPPTSRHDVASRRSDFKRANKFKKTKRHKRAIAETYKEQPPAQRRKIRKNVTGAERKVIQKAHKEEVKRKRISKRATARRTGASDADMRRANKYKAKHPEVFSRGIPLPQNTTPMRAGLVPGSAAGKWVEKVTQNVAREAIDIPANIVPTASYLADPIIKKPLKPKSYLETGKRAGEAAASLPIELYKHPGKTITEHPLSTALLVAPIPKVPVRSSIAAKRRIPGKERKPDIVELPGTKLKENRPTTTGYARNIKKRVALKKGLPVRREPSKTVTAKEIETRIDEDVALMEGLTRREGAKTAKKVYKARKEEHRETMPKKEAKRLAGREAAETAQKIEKKVRDEQTQKMINTMGITEKPIGRPGEKAKIYKELAAAETIAKRAGTGDVEFVPYRTKGGYAVIPEAASKRWKEHTEAKEFSPAEAITRIYSTQWRRNVLALHPTWYTGNVMEAALRAAVAGAGPTSFYRGYKVPKTLKTMDPAAHRELGGRVYAGGHLAMQANLPREFQLNVSGSGTIAKGLRAMQAARKEKPAVKNVVDAWEGFSDFTMGTLSGGVEGFFQRGMLGKALSKDPLMDGHMIKISKAAIEDAAKGLTKTENQVKMGRIVDEMYGRYGKWSPGMRRVIANYTPFISWTMNAMNFLYRTLPRDHPVMVAAAASVQPYVDEWRKDKGLSKFVRGAVPAFLQGAVPTKEGLARYPTRYTPFSVAAQFPEGIGDLILPQYSSAIELMKSGVNWKGQKVQNPDGTPLDPIQRILAATLTLYEGAVPASQQISGPLEKYEKGERNLGKLLKPKPAKDIPEKFDPFRKVALPEKDKKTVAKKPKSFFDSAPSGKSFFGP